MTMVSVLALAVQDLNIDLQALAASLSKVPVWTVLDIDAALCKSCLSKYNTSLQHSANTSMDSKPNCGPSNTAVQPSTAAHSKFSVEAPLNDAFTDRTTKCSSHTAAISEPDATTASACPAPAGESTAKVQTQPAANRPPQLPADHSLASLQTGRDAAAGKADIDDLDALLNAPHSSIKPQQSVSSASKPAAKQQESLEDWLDSL